MKNTIKIMLPILAVTLITGIGTANMAEAKAKAYKTKTIKVTEGKSKTIKTKKKIKKIVVTKGKNSFGVGLVHKDGSVSDNPNAAKGKKKFTVWGTGYGRKYEVKVTYTNNCTQKFKIKTVPPSYAKKIVDELKPLLADPDKGLQIVLAQWEKKLGHECEFRLTNVSVDGNATNFTLDEVMENYTTSQKKALILDVYFRNRMSYSTNNGGKYIIKNRGSNAYFKKLYNGTFKGICSDGAAMAYDICQYLGIKAYYASSHYLDHAWCGIWVTDKNGNSYWHGIETTSGAYNLKSSVPKNNRDLTKKQLEKYYYNPYISKIRADRKAPARPTRPPKPVAAETPDTTETSAPTASLTITEPIKDADGNTLVMPSVGYTCPGCSPLNPPPVRHTDNTNPYITNSKTTYKDYAVYQHVIGTEVRYFDENGNEYFDVNNNGTIMDELIGVAG